MSEQISETLGTINDLKNLFLKKKSKFKQKHLFSRSSKQSPKKQKKFSPKPKQNNFMSKIYKQILNEKSPKSVKSSQKATPSKRTHIDEFQTPAFISEQRISEEKHNFQNKRRKWLQDVQKQASNRRKKQKNDGLGRLGYKELILKAQNLSKRINTNGFFN